MASGPPPSDNPIRRNKPAQKLVIAADGKKRGFNLPPLVDSEGNPDGDWHPMTKKWWNSWRTSPQASQMLSEPDWMFLLDTALMHHQMWSRGKWEFASEIRLRVQKFGATPEDRQRLRQEIHVEEIAPVGTASGNVTDLNSERRNRVRKNMAKNA